MKDMNEVPEDAPGILADCFSRSLEDSTLDCNPRKIVSKLSCRRSLQPIALLSYDMQGSYVIALVAQSDRASVS